MFGIAPWKIHIEEYYFPPFLGECETGHTIFTDALSDKWLLTYKVIHFSYKTAKTRAGFVKNEFLSYQTDTEVYFIHLVFLLVNFIACSIYFYWKGMAFFAEKNKCDLTKLKSSHSPDITACPKCTSHWNQQQTGMSLPHQISSVLKRRGGPECMIASWNDGWKLGIIFSHVAVFPPKIAFMIAWFQT